MDEVQAVQNLKIAGLCDAGLKRDWSTEDESES